MSISGIVSLALGFFHDFGTPPVDNEPRVEWVEGVAIIIAIVIVVCGAVRSTPCIWQDPDLILPF